MSSPSASSASASAGAALPFAAAAGAALPAAAFAGALPALAAGFAAGAADLADFAAGFAGAGVASATSSSTAVAVVVGAADVFRAAGTALVERLASVDAEADERELSAATARRAAGPAGTSMRDAGVVERPEHGLHPGHRHLGLLAGLAHGGSLHAAAGGAQAQELLQGGMSELGGQGPGGRDRRHGQPFVVCVLGRCSRGAVVRRPASARPRLLNGLGAEILPGRPGQSSIVARASAPGSSSGRTACDERPCSGLCPRLGLHRLLVITDLLQRRRVDDIGDGTATGFSVVAGRGLPPGGADAELLREQRDEDLRLLVAEPGQAADATEQLAARRPRRARSPRRRRRTRRPPGPRAPAPGHPCWRGSGGRRAVPS